MISWARSNPTRAATLFGWFQQACTIGGALLIIPVVIKSLGADTAGLWFSLQGFVALSMLVDFGFGVAISRQVAYSLRRNAGVEYSSPDLIKTPPGWEGVALLYAASRALFQRALVIAVVLFVAVHEWIIPLTNLRQPESAEMTAVWYLLAGSIAFNVYTRLTQSFLDGLGYMFASRIVASCFQLCMNLGLVLVLYGGGGLLAMAAVSMGASILQLVAMHWAFACVDERPRECRNKTDRQLLMGLWKVSVPIGVMGSGALLVGVTQVPLLGALLGAAVVTPIYIAIKASQALNTAIFQLAASQLAFFTQDCAQGHWASARERMRKTLLAGLVLQLAAAFGLWFVMPEVTDRWVGPGHYLSGTVLAAFVLNYFITSVAALPAQFVLASGRNPFALCTITHGILTLGGMVLLCPYMGLLGVPVAALVAVLMTNAWLNPLQAGRLWKALSHNDRGLPASDPY